MPAGQVDLTLDDVDGHALPIGQLVQEVDLAPEYEPGGQASGASDGELHLDPAGQSVQFAAFPIANVPAGQRSGYPSGMKHEYPAGQGVQDVAPASENVPTGHLTGGNFVLGQLHPDSQSAHVGEADEE